MELAVNYSAAAAELYAEELIQVERFKCPAWPALLNGIEVDVPVYVHFPLLVGTGQGQPVDTETDTAPDWTGIDTLLGMTATPWISTHLGPRPADFPMLTQRPWDEQIRIIQEALIGDLTSLVARFGSDAVVAENIFEYFGMHLRPAVLPNVISEVIESAGCGFLLDLSHARLAARDLSMDPQSYIEALPVTHIREIHVTGIQRFDAHWVERFRKAGIDADRIAQLENRWIDHLPMTEEDFDFFAWVLERIRSGAWRTPEIIAFEYGGVGPEFSALTLKDVLAEQVPRLHAMVHGTTNKACILRTATQFATGETDD